VEALADAWLERLRALAQVGWVGAMEWGGGGRRPCSALHVQPSHLSLPSPALASSAHFCLFPCPCLLPQTRRGVAELLVRAGNKPTGAAATPEALSFWVANLICPVLDSEAALKLRLVSTRSSLERLQYERQVLQQLSASSAQGCTVM